MIARSARAAAALVALGSLLIGAPRVLAASIDGVSDQSLPAWDGSYSASPLARLLAPRLGLPAPQIRLARYVLQWNALGEPSGGPAPAGDYRERFEAWLGDIGGAGLRPVVALTSYDGSYPRSQGAYTAALQATLARALALGSPIAYVEPWNEPNNQGREPAATAAAFAGAANALCASLGACEVVAGDFEDGPALAAYERAYERALTFTPRIWGVHPYHAIAARDEAPLRRLRDGLPRRGAGAALWYTEVASFYCRRGRVLGEAAQAAQARYLRDVLLADRALAPAHAFYYGLLFADHRAAPCSARGGDDSELYAPDDRPRAAAAVLLGAAAATPAQAFGPSPLEAAAR